MASCGETAVQCGSVQHSFLIVRLTFSHFLSKAVFNKHHVGYPLPDLLSKSQLHRKISQKNHAIVYPDTTTLRIVGGLSVCLSVSEPRVPGNTLPRTGGGPGLKGRGSPGSCQGRAADKSGHRHAGARHQSGVTARENCRVQTEMQICR